MKLERETWKPMHEMRVKDGSILSWAVIDQAMPGDESNGPVVATVTTFRGWPDPTKTDWDGLVKKAHPQTQPETIFTQTEAARKIVRSEIWHVIDQTTPVEHQREMIQAEARKGQEEGRVRVAPLSTVAGPLNEKLLEI